MLDFGCGPGRDLKALGELGHIAVGLEGAARLAVMTPELGSLTAQLRETRGESCRALLTADVSSRMHATTDTVLASALVTLFMTIPTFLIFGVNVRFWPYAAVRAGFRPPISELGHPHKLQVPVGIAVGFSFSC